jgi:hypothetical protein
MEGFMQRVLVLITALAFGAILATIFVNDGASAQAKLAQAKGKANCSYEACVSGCNTRGGQPRFCGDYCTKQMSQRKAAGQC